MEASWIAIGGLVLTLVTYAVAATLYTSRIELNANRQIAVAKEDLNRTIDQSKDLVVTIIDRELQKEQKARHDLASHLQLQFQGYDRDLRDFRTEISQMVRKEDLAATEMRLTIAVDKLEKHIEKCFDDWRAERTGHA